MRGSCLVDCVSQIGFEGVFRATSRANRSCPRGHSVSMGLFPRQGTYQTGGAHSQVCVCVQCASRWSTQLLTCFLRRLKGLPEACRHKRIDMLCPSTSCQCRCVLTWQCIFTRHSVPDAGVICSTLPSLVEVNKLIPCSQLTREIMHAFVQQFGIFRTFANIAFYHIVRQP